MRNIITVVYVFFLTYLLFIKVNASKNIDLVPLFLDTILPTMGIVYNFSTLFSFNVVNFSLECSLFATLFIFCNKINILLLIVVIFFTFIFSILINSFLYVNKVFTMYNFLNN